MTAPNDPAGDAALRARLQRMEESHAFLEHQLEQLNAELVHVNRRVAELLLRLAKLEAGAGAAPAGASTAAGVEQPVTLDQAERRAIVDALAQSAGSRERAAQALGVDLDTLQRKLLRHGLA